MTKQEWLDCKDLDEMLKEIKSDRKKQLFSLACCRSIEHLLPDQRSKDCLDKLEDFIDGKIGREELETVRQTAWAASDNATVSVYAANAAAREVYYSAYYAYAAARAVAYFAYYAYHYVADYAAHANVAERFEILRDIYNPYLLDLKFSSLAISLALQVYEGDTSARFVLSDYLEEEGYPDEIVLHLKSGEHYKGCWLIDQILGKV